MPSQQQHTNADMSVHYQELMELTVQVSLACMASGLRYWQRTAELSSDYILALSNNLAEMNTPSGNREAAWHNIRNHFRSYVRIMGDLSRQESRHLQDKLKTIERTTWPAPAQTSPFWRRRARVKQ